MDLQDFWPRGNDPYAFLTVALFRSYGIRGVLSLMLGFLFGQIMVVLRFGIEPKKRRLEDMEQG